MRVVWLEIFKLVLFLAILPIQKVMAKMKHHPIKLDEIKSYVMLKNSLEDSKAICGGTLITLSMVVTAAECLADRLRRRSIFFGYIIAGTISQSKCEDLCQHQTVMNLFVHGRYYYAQENPPNLGLIETSFPFKQTEAVAPALLIAWTLPIGTTVDIVGVTTGDENDIVQQGQTIVIDSSICRDHRGESMYMCVDPDNFNVGSPVFEGGNHVAGLVISNNGDGDEKKLVLHLLYYQHYLAGLKGDIRRLISHTSKNFARTLHFKFIVGVVLWSLAISYGM